MAQARVAATGRLSRNGRSRFHIGDAKKGGEKSPSFFRFPER
jgi:hypothetical protein